jgi:cell division protease FtsH
MRQMQGGKGGAMGFGKSKAKLMDNARKKVTFDDVAALMKQKRKCKKL